MTYELILSRVSDELNLPVDLIRNTYKAYWQFIRDTILELPLKSEMTDEEFEKLRVNFNIPSLGKLCCTADKYQKVKRRFKYIQNIRNKNA